MALALLHAVALTAAGCGDGGDGGSTVTTTAGSTTGSGGAAAGTGGAGGAGGTGGSGGAGAACLDPSVHANLFAITDPALCAVAAYEAAADFSASAPAWGRHGGPLTVGPGATQGAIDLVRWQVPGEPTGMLVASTTTIGAAYPMGTFLGLQAVDLPFFNWTVASWTGAFPDTAGEALVLDGAAIVHRYPVSGFFAAQGSSAAPDEGRLIHSSLSAIEDTAGMQSGLYAADSCGSPGQNPRLVPDTDTSCGVPIAIAAWGDSTGPVAADRNGNVFAVMTSFAAGDQEARGFEASTVARGAAPTAGDTLFTLPGFGSSLATIGPDTAGTGRLVLQPFDGSTFAALDVIAQQYSASGNVITAQGSVAPLLTLATPNTTVALFSDDTGRLWVAAPGQTSGTTQIIVIAPVP
jgi:hypothetical protein